MNAAGPASASHSLRDLFDKMKNEFPRHNVGGNRPHQEVLNDVLDLLSGILCSKSDEGQEQKLQKIKTAIKQIDAGEGIFSNFTSNQKVAVKNILEYAKGNVDEDEAVELIELHCEGFQGGKRKRRKTTRRRKHKKSMKKRKTRGRK